MDDRSLRQRLIVFTRYPEAGKAKTRLIPALGAVGAAVLHRQMVEHTLAQVRSLPVNHSLTVEIWFVGGECAQMQAWLGDEWQYQMQPTGDLGDRMAQAFQTAFQAGNDAVVIIGTDCPEVDANLLDKAFRELQQHDLVLGTAADGGYYLIGLRQFVPDLFQGIPWSTSVVFQQTVAIAERLGLTVATLPVLSDVDYPADLEIWQRVNGATQQAQVARSHPPRISVIIPVLNEAANLARTLERLHTATNVEIIVVDGGSQDHTATVAKTLGATVLTAPRGRATQMNTGAIAATGDILLFLHGDTRLPVGFDALIRQTLAHPNVIAGAFKLAIDANIPGIRLVEWGVNWRSRWLQLPYGDQGIFLKAETFHQIGAFANLPIMEDFELMQRLRQLGNIAIVPASVLTAGRRWQTYGVIKTTLINQLIVAGYRLGVSPDHLARWYRRG